MQELPASYLAEIARNIAAVSAFLGGFSAAFVAAIISGKFHSRPASVTIFSATLSSILLIVTVLSTTMLVVTLHPDAPTKVVGTSLSMSFARIIAFASFTLGIYLILLALGTSGWIHSRKAGIASTAGAAIGFILVTLIIIGI